MYMFTFSLQFFIVWGLFILAIDLMGSVVRCDITMGGCMECVRVNGARYLENIIKEVSQ